MAMRAGRHAFGAEQTSHGLRPYSAFLGALRVSDEVGVEAEVDLSGLLPAGGEPRAAAQAGG